MSLEKPTWGVQLGRFAPYHKGHQLVTEALRARYGDRALVLIGSSNSFQGEPPRNERERVQMSRTPFTYEERRNMIVSVYPDLKVLPLPDVNPDPTQHDHTFRAWLEQIHGLESQLEAKFCFVGGADEDLRYLAAKFPTECVVDRHEARQELSATMVRHALEEHDFNRLNDWVDRRVWPQAVYAFDENSRVIQGGTSYDPLEFKRHSER